MTAKPKGKLSGWPRVFFREVGMTHVPSLECGLYLQQQRDTHDPNLYTVKRFKRIIRVDGLMLPIDVVVVRLASTEL